VPTKSAAYQESVRDTVLFRPTVLAIRKAGLVWVAVVAKSMAVRSLRTADSNPTVPKPVLKSAELSIQVIEEQR
jgi:hypothetical protein